MASPRLVRSWSRRARRRSPGGRRFDSVRPSRDRDGLEHRDHDALTEQRQSLRDRLAELLRQDSDGLLSELRADGAVSLALDGRFQHAIVARPRATGRPELACFDDADAAVSFFARDDRRAPVSDPPARAPQPEERDR